MKRSISLLLALALLLVSQTTLAVDTNGSKIIEPGSTKQR